MKYENLKRSSKVNSIGSVDRKGSRVLAFETLVSHLTYVYLISKGIRVLAFEIFVSHIAYVFLTVSLSTCHVRLPRRLWLHA